MKRILAATLLALAASSFAAGQTTNKEAKEALNEGTRLYQAGKFAEAQQQFEKAIQLDPAEKDAPFFMARAIHSQYQPGIETPENTAKAHEAITAYQRALETNPDNEEAYNAVASLYRAAKEEDREHQWIADRAASASISNEKRAEAYAVLANKQWQCSSTITESKENQQTVTKDGSAVIRYVKPKDENDFFKAQQCATRGLESVEQAIGLNSESEIAWSYKANLLNQLARLAEMQGEADQRAEYTRQAQEAQQRTSELNDVNKQRKNLEEGNSESGQPRSNQSNAGPASNSGTGSTTKRRTIVSGGVLNGRAISKPVPPYPQEAKAARASGTVTVQIVIDEEGTVTSATAASGHPLLRAAAEQAALQARFPQTRLSGQPVKVSGVVTYNFVLQ